MPPFEEILTRLPKPVAVLSMQQEVRYANPAFAAALGQRRVDLARLTERIAATPELVGPLGRASLRLRGPRTVIRWTVRDGDDGETYEVTITRCGQDAVVLVLDRVTAQVRVEEIHARTRAYLEGVLNSLGLGIIVFDETCHITFISRDQGRMLDQLRPGTTFLETIGSPVSDVYPMLSAAEWESTLAQVVGRREAVTHPRLTCPAAGAERCFALSVVPLVDLHQQLIGGVAVTEDVTRFVTLEQEVVSRERLALLGQMAIAVNHEINNPLTVVIGEAEMALWETPLEASTAERLRVIAAHAQRIADATRRLREIEGIELAEYIEGGPLMLSLVPRAGEGCRAATPGGAICRYDGAEDRPSRREAPADAADRTRAS